MPLLHAHAQWGLAPLHQNSSPINKKDGILFATQVKGAYVHMEPP